MDNVKVTVKGDEAIITVNLKAEGRVSASQKTMVIASTRGNITIPGTDIKLGLNAYKPNKG